MIDVGDSASDLQAFGCIEGAGGLALAIAKDETYGHEDQMLQSQRVESLATPDRSEGGELPRSLIHAAEVKSARIALKALGRGK
ncbi:hypothetical protein [Roseitranquillus sediminis]|uniref:hypothetical protein n=1 Tax=Roseitranquillus sediminis TaxID=2809051 RepID=UPI001D0CB811|nr:hypothetical protein [Roseitranquillus sediminis]MBM9593773.1 hypothetical protein [Roseitranquillus sediminis]